MELTKDTEEYLDDWTKMMVDIFQERVSRLRIVDTGEFYNSFKSRLDAVAQGRESVTRFLEYGMYQALGVGNGYSRENGGDLEILDPEYRRTHKMGKPRKRRDWFSRKWFMSVMNAVEDLARITGEESAQILCDSLSDARQTIRRENR